MGELEPCGALKCTLFFSAHELGSMRLLPFAWDSPHHHQIWSYQWREFRLSLQKKGRGENKSGGKYRMFFLV